MAHGPSSSSDPAASGSTRPRPLPHLTLFLYGSGGSAQATPQVTKSWPLLLSCPPPQGPWEPGAQAGRASRWGLLLSQHLCQSGDLYLHTVQSCLPVELLLQLLRSAWAGLLTPCPSHVALSYQDGGVRCQRPGPHSRQHLYKKAQFPLRRRGRLGEQRNRSLCPAQAGSVRGLLLDLCGDRQLWTRSLAR